MKITILLLLVPIFVLLESWDAAAAQLNTSCKDIDGCSEAADNQTTESEYTRTVDEEGNAHYTGKAGCAVHFFNMRGFPAEQSWQEVYDLLILPDTKDLNQQHYHHARIITGDSKGIDGYVRDSELKEAGRFCDLNIQPGSASTDAAPVVRHTATATVPVITDLSSWWAKIEDRGLLYICLAVIVLYLARRRLPTSLDDVKKIFLWIDRTISWTQKAIGNLFLTLFAAGIFFGSAYGLYYLCSIWHKASQEGFAIGLFLGMVACAAAMFAVLSALWEMLIRYCSPKKSSPHGDTQLATEKDLRAAGVSPHSSNNIYLGYFWNKKSDQSTQYSGDRHIILLGPNGSGKTTAFAIPVVSDLNRSILCTDPKGEICAVTFRKRSKLGTSIILNPFNVMDMGSHGFNPLLRLVPYSDDFVRRATNIARAIVKTNPRDNQPHFVDSARALFCALTMWECITAKRDARTPSLINVRNMVSAPRGLRDGAGNPTHFDKTLADMLTSGYTPLVNKVGRFMEDTKEVPSIISSAILATEFMDEPAIAKDLSQGNIDFGILKRELATVYVILPPNQLADFSAWMRLIVECALMDLYTVPGEKRVLFLLEEFAQLGHMEIIAEAVGIARGYTVQLCMILQTLSQLKSNYKNEYNNFIGNSGVFASYAPRDLESARYLSEVIGQKTEHILTESKDGFSISPQGFPMFRPENLMRMPDRQMICMVDASKPDGTKVFPYQSYTPHYEQTPFKKGLSANPYARKGN